MKTVKTGAGIKGSTPKKKSAAKKKHVVIHGLSRVTATEAGRKTGPKKSPGAELSKKGTKSQSNIAKKSNVGISGASKISRPAKQDQKPIPNTPRTWSRAKASKDRKESMKRAGVTGRQ